MTIEKENSGITDGCDLTVIILTLNEEQHIARCIRSVRDIARRIVIIDSGSLDRTCDIARDLGAEVLVNPFESHARQLNWGLNSSNISTSWVMKLDADEYLTPNARDVIPNSLIGLSDDVSGITLNLRRIFMGKWLKHGSLYPIKLLRIWRFGLGRVDERLMDEHVSVEGRVIHLNADFADHNLGTLTTWVDKHNKYASREAVELLNLKFDFLPRHTGTHFLAGNQATTKRWLKEKVYARLPVGVRSLAYFLYRYVLRLGFLDGREGAIFHVLQGFFYRYLVDSKVSEVNAYMQSESVGVDVAVENVLGIKIQKK